MADSCFQVTWQKRYTCGWKHPLSVIQAKEQLVHAAPALLFEDLAHEPGEHKPGLVDKM